MQADDVCRKMNNSQNFIQCEEKDLKKIKELSIRKGMIDITKRLKNKTKMKGKKKQKSKSKRKIREKKRKPKRKKKKKKKKKHVNKKKWNAVILKD